MKILCLGNEFIKEDSLAKEIGCELAKEGYGIINIKDSFQLISEINNNPHENFAKFKETAKFSGESFENSLNNREMVNYSKSSDEIIILDVAEGIKEVKLLKIEELSDNSVITSHDIDAQFILKLFKDKNIFIIGIPMNGEAISIKKNIRTLLSQYESLK